MSRFKKYRRLPEITEMRPYEPGEELDDAVSISEADKKNGHPMKGGMIARDPNDPSDKWYIRPGYFERNFETDPVGEVSD